MPSMLKKGDSNKRRRKMSDSNRISERESPEAIKDKIQENQVTHNGSQTSSNIKGNRL